MRYRINPGHSFRMEDGSIASAGSEIELGDDIAAANPGAAERLPDEEQPQPAGEQPAGDEHQTAA